MPDHPTRCACSSPALAQGPDLRFGSTPSAAPGFAAMALLFCAADAWAATASVDIPIVLQVDGPVCTVSNQSAAIALLAASPAQTWAQFLTASGITTTATSWGGSTLAGRTSAALNQTATITCNLANVPIQSVVVQPGASAYVTGSGGSGMQFLIDAASPTPNKLANRQVFAEQVSVNGTAAAHPYVDANTWAINPYTTAFTTGALDGGTSSASLVWRPVFDSYTTTTPLGSPVGGSFNGAYRVVVNY